jgi:hypothetical protein
MANPMIYSYAQIKEPRPPISYAIDKLLPENSVSIFYGYPGSGKSLICLDMMMAIATGKNFLPARPNSKVSYTGYKVLGSPVLWVDFDQGLDISFEREEAIGKSYQATDITPFFHVSMPDWKGSNTKSVDEMISHIKSLGGIAPRVICIDTLLRFAGVPDENSSIMDQVMKSLRRIAEELHAAVIVISHSNKVNIGRAGNALRGHSSIEGGVDSVFRVSRDGNSDIIEIEQQKARRNPIDPFSARFTFEHKPGTDELEEARFYFEPVVTGSSPKQAKQKDIEETILNVLADSGQKMGTSKLYAEVKGNHAEYYRALKKLVNDLAVTKWPNLINKSWTEYEITALGRGLI